MRILIIRVSAIGDVVHTIPSLYLLNHHFPEAQIHWLVQKKAADLLVGHPLIHNVLVLPDKFLHPTHWGETRAIMQQIRNQKWDAIIDFQGLLKTTMLLIPLKGSKYGFSAHHVREKITALFTNFHDTPTYTNIVQKNLSLASAICCHLGNKAPSPSPAELKKLFAFSVPENKQDTVNRWLEEHQVTKPLLLCPNTTWKSKHWPEDYWVSFIEQYDHQQGLVPVLVGVNFSQAAANIAKRCADKNIKLFICPPWDLLTMSYLIKKAALVIAPDTGLLHLADFLGTNTIGLFGPTSKKRSGPFWVVTNQTSTIQAQENNLSLYKPEQLIADIVKAYDPRVPAKEFYAQTDGNH